MEAIISIGMTLVIIGGVYCYFWFIQPYLENKALGR